jgi:hypothetical protein
MLSLSWLFANKLFLFKFFLYFQDEFFYLLY